MCGRKVRADVGVVTTAATISPQHGWGPCGWFGRSFGSETEALAPRRQVERALSALAPAAAGAAFIFAVVPWASWVVFAFGWMLFPAVGLLARGLVGVAREAEPGLRDALRERLTRTLTPSAGGPSSLLRSIRATAAGLQRPEAREGGRRVAEAADRLAAAGEATGPETAQWVAERYLRPTLQVLERYARVAAEPKASGPALREIEAEGLPAVAAKLDQLRAEIERDTKIASVAS